MLCEVGILEATVLRTQDKVWRGKSQELIRRSRYQVYKADKFQGGNSSNDWALQTCDRVCQRLAKGVAHLGYYSLQGKQLSWFTSLTIYRFLARTLNNKTHDCSFTFNRQWMVSLDPSLSAPPLTICKTRWVCLLCGSTLVTKKVCKASRHEK